MPENATHPDPAERLERPERPLDSNRMPPGAQKLILAGHWFASYTDTHLYFYRRQSGHLYREHIRVLLPEGCWELVEEVRRQSEASGQSARDVAQRALRALREHPGPQGARTAPHGDRRPTPAPSAGPHPRR